MSQVFLITWPIGTNAIWRSYRGRNILSQRYRAWRDLVGKELMIQRARPIAGPVAIQLELNCPTARAYDLDGRIKSCLDALVDRGVIEDDNNSVVEAHHRVRRRRIHRRARHGLAVEHSAMSDRKRIQLVPFDKIRLGTERSYLIKNLIPRVGLTVVWGPPKSGKSFWTFDLVMHVALGWEYRGLRVHQGPVVYCAFEGQSGIKARVEAFRQRHLAEQVDPVPLYVVPVVMDLAKDRSELISAIRTDAVPAAVVLDTLNRSLGGSESSDEHMGAYIKAADAIREAFNCAVIIVHHCGVNESRPRGHTSLTGAVDAQLAVKRDVSGTIVVTVEWMKDGSGEGDIIASRLETLEVGQDEDGEAVTSCVIAPAETPQRAQKAAKLSANQQTAFNLLDEAGAAGLALDEWNAKLRAEGIGTTRKATLYDIRKDLHDRRFIHSCADRWYVTR